MKRWLGVVVPAVAVGLAFSSAGQIDDWFLRLLALWGSVALLQVLFIPRWPRREALRQALRLRDGERIEAEGRPGGRLWARQEGR